MLSVFGLVVLSACDSSKSKKTSSESKESLTLGISHPGNLSYLIWIAEDRGYFAEHGLKVDVKLYESALAATRDLAAGKVDLATATDFVTARYILERTDFRIITSFCESDDVKLVARKDHGITQISDIRHKRVGVLRGGGGEFFLDLLVAAQNIPSQEVQKVDLPPSEQAKAISKGDVDAVVIWEPFLTEVSNNLGTNALTWSAQSGQSYYWLLLGTADVISKRPRAIQDFVSSLVSAEEFIKNQRHESKRIVARKLGVSDLESLWKGTLFEVGLDHPLILTIEAQMRWMNPDLQTDQSNMPDILKFIYFDALNSVQTQRIKMLY
jgi:NitT/TauT family transport system substrate-binding protein